MVIWLVVLASLLRRVAKPAKRAVKVLLRRDRQTDRTRERERERKRGAYNLSAQGRGIKEVESSNLIARDSG